MSAPEQLNRQMLKYKSDHTISHILTEVIRFKFLLDQTFPLMTIFIVNDEKIMANRYMLSASSDYFRREFASVGSNLTDPAVITIKGIQPNSMRILLCYLYSQNLDDAVNNLHSLNDDKDNRRVMYDNNQPPNLALYKDLLKLAIWTI